MLTTDQAARRLRVTPSRIRQLCITGRIPGAQFIGRQWFIPRGFKVERVKLGRPIGS